MISSNVSPSIDLCLLISFLRCTCFFFNGNGAGRLQGKRFSALMAHVCNEIPLAFSCQCKPSLQVTCHLLICKWYANCEWNLMCWSIFENFLSCLKTISITHICAGLEPKGQDSSLYAIYVRCFCQSPLVSQVLLYPQGGIHNGHLLSTSRPRKVCTFELSDSSRHQGMDSRIWGGTSFSTGCSAFSEKQTILLVYPNSNPCRSVTRKQTNFTQNALVVPRNNHRADLLQTTPGTRPCVSRLSPSWKWFFVSVPRKRADNGDIVVTPCRTTLFLSFELPNETPNYLSVVRSWVVCVCVCVCVRLSIMVYGGLPHIRRCGK